MKKQSSIEWLVKQIWKNEPLEHEQKAIEQAKEIHKKEIIDAYVYGVAYQIDIKNGLSPIIYYNEIFEK